MKKALIILFAAFLIFGLFGCSSNENHIVGADLVCESVISPNEEYIKSDEDKVVLEVKVYQKKDHTIIVYAKANTEFFEDKEYALDYDKEISEADVNIEWTTLLGNKESTKEDQTVVATVTISDGDMVISERKINFAKNAMDIIVENIQWK